MECPGKKRKGVTSSPLPFFLPCTAVSGEHDDTWSYGSHFATLRSSSEKGDTEAKPEP